jgi:hypothetical protein
MPKNDWFPTPIWHFSIDEHPKLNPALLKEIKTEQDRDQKGETVSNILGWHSTNILHKRDSFHDLNQIILANTIEIANFRGGTYSKFL